MGNTDCMTKLAPHLAHNEKLYKEFMDKSGNPPLFPRVSKQIASVQINPVALSPWAYNPSIALWDNRLLMAYRWHNEKDYRTSLAIAELDANFNVRKNSAIDVPLKGEWESVEDPRLFLRHGQLWMSYTLSNWPSKQPRCVVQYGRLQEAETWRVESVFQPRYGKNDGTALEKNFIFYQNGDRLSCFYNATTIIDLDGADVIEQRPVECPHWLWGAAKGGTPWFGRDGQVFRFFHSSLDFEPRPYRRRYYLGAMDTEGHISRQPIAVGSEEDDIPPEQRNNCLQWKPKVIFPGGAIEWEGGYLVAVGVNDCESILLKIKPQDLHL